MITQAEFFDSYADRWDAMELDDIHLRLDRVVREARIIPDMQILDVGTGTGVLIPCLLKAMNGSGSIHAIDISRGMLTVAGSKGFPNNVCFELADIHEFACPDCTYDAVMCNAVFPHFADKNHALVHIHRMLRPDGLIVISHPTGREAVNKIHREAGSDVAEDRVPSAENMHRILSEAGFVDISVTNELEFYMAIGRKSQP